MAGYSVKVKGLRELQRDFSRLDKTLNKDLDRELREAGDIVSQDARSRFSGIDARSAAGFRPRTKGFGRVVVEQRKGRTTGQHPEYGAMQMRLALLPALASKRGEVEDAVDKMLGRLAGEF